MKRLNKKQRRLIYKKTLKNFNETFGLCSNLSPFVFNIFLAIKDIFPEFDLFRPSRVYQGFW